MASVLGLDREQVDAICQEVEGLVVGASYNAPGQIVISGKRRCGACRGLAKARGAAACSLNVSGAFHSPLMQPAADRLGEVLNTTPSRMHAYPSWPMSSASRFRPHSTIRTALLQQMTGSVLWEDTVRRMAADG